MLVLGKSHANSKHRLQNDSPAMFVCFLFQTVVRMSSGDPLCPKDIFCLAKSFVTKLGMVVHHHGPKCHSKINVLLSSRSWSQGL